MSSEAPEYILVALPGASDGWRNLEKTVGGLAELFKFDVPTLRVGTLEKLMSAGDALAKADVSIESVLRKIERTYGEVQVNNEPLTVEGDPVQHFVQNFRWNTAKYQSTRPIDELIKLLMQNGQKIEDELKEATIVFQEAKQVLNIASRKKGGNLMSTSNLLDFMPNVDPIRFQDSEFLCTVFVVLSKSSEETFLSTYEQLADDSVGYGPADDRMSVLGSPVVPQSATFLAEDADNYLLYSMTILKQYKDVFTQAAQQARFMVRELRPGSAAGGSAASAAADNDDPKAKLSQAENEFGEAKKQLQRWIMTHYGEAFIAWMHVKTIRVFVEAVLRYGLPVDFTAALIKPGKKGGEKKLRDRLADLHASLVGEDAHKGVGDVGNESAGASAGLSREVYYPYVSFTFKPTSE